MNAKEWIAAFSQQLGIDPPSPDDFRQILDLAAIAAHASERVAAPVACWVAATAGVNFEDALRIAGTIGEQRQEASHG